MAQPPPPALEIGEVAPVRPRLPRVRIRLPPYARFRLSTRAAARWNMLGAFVGLHLELYLARVLSLSPDPEIARLWAPVHFLLQCFCFAATAYILYSLVRWYMAVDGVEVNPPPAVELLPPPPPEMDMC